jgi:hypothetical protein
MSHEMSDRRPTRLRRADVLRPPRASIGTHGSEHFLRSLRVEP